MAATSTVPPRVGWYQVLYNEAKRADELTEVTKWDAKIVQAGDFAIPQKFYIFNNFATPDGEADCADMINCYISVRDMLGGLGTGNDGTPEDRELGNYNSDKNSINPYDRAFDGNAITGGGQENTYGSRATVYMVMFYGEHSEPGDTSPSGGWGYFRKDTGAFQCTFASESDITDGDSQFVNNPENWQPLNSAAADARHLCNAMGQQVDDSLDNCFCISGKRANIETTTWGGSEGQNIWDVTTQNKRMLNCAVVYLTLHANSEAAAGTVMWRTRVSYQFR